MPTFTANIPQPGDIPAQSQDQILNNFQSINQANVVDQIDFNDAVNYGKSKYTHLKNAGTPTIPIPTTTSDEGALYTKVVNSDSQLFWRFKNNGTELQLTHNALSAVATPGCTPLPGNMLMQWGNAFISSGGTAVNFYTSFATCFNVQLTYLNAADDVTMIVYVKSFSATGFVGNIYTRSGGGAGQTVYYVAIGSAPV